jgi:hypothetical protein
MPNLTPSDRALLLAAFRRNQRALRRNGWLIVAGHLALAVAIVFVLKQLTNS